MKEIKFRGKKLHKGDWAYGYYLPWHSVKDMTGKDVYAQIFEEEGEKHPKGWEKVIASTICQFTGLYDKNGKEIYEGDIVKRDFNGVGQVIFDDFDSSFSLYNVHTGKSVSLFKHLCNHYEVIGNIYDNPELIKEQNEITQK